MCPPLAPASIASPVQSPHQPPHTCSSPAPPLPLPTPAATHLSPLALRTVLRVLRVAVQQLLLGQPRAQAREIRLVNGPKRPAAAVPLQPAVQCEHVHVRR